MFCQTTDVKACSSLRRRQRLHAVHWNITSNCSQSACILQPYNKEFSQWDSFRGITSQYEQRHVDNCPSYTLPQRPFKKPEVTLKTLVWILPVCLTRGESTSPSGIAELQSALFTAEPSPSTQWFGFTGQQHIFGEHAAEVRVWI